MCLSLLNHHQWMSLNATNSQVESPVDSVVAVVFCMGGVSVPFFRPRTAIPLFPPSDMIDKAEKRKLTAVSYEI